MRLLTELRRRHVFRVAAAYGVAAWLTIQVSELAFPRLGLPDWTVTLVLVLALVGLPLALVLAWAYELTPDGIRDDDGQAQQIGERTKRRKSVDRLIILGLGVAVVILLAERLWTGKSEDPRSASGETVSSLEPFGASSDDRSRSSEHVHSLVVLPFANLSDNSANEYFADGLSEELMNVLDQAPSLRVIGRTSSFAWKGRNEDVRTIGSALGVEHVLEGSIRRQGDRVRVTVQLVQAADGFHAWSANYDRMLDDVFVIQDDIAANVLRALKIVLDDDQARAMRRAGVRDVDAFVAYQKGYEQWNRAHWESSIAAGLAVADKHLLEAIARVPEFGAAHLLRADLQIHRLAAAPGYLTRDQQLETLASLRETLTAAYDSSPDPLRRAIVDVERVLFSEDWSPLRARIEKALAEPGCARTLLLESAMTMGYADELQELYGREVRCEPLNAVLWWDLALSALWAGDPKRALDLLDEAESALGEQTLLAFVRVQALLSLDRVDEAVRVADRIPVDQDLFGIAVRAFVAAAAGRPEAAIDALERQRPLNPVGAMDQSLLVYAAAGDRARANQIAAELDARPGGPAVMMMWIGGCACGLPFEVDATPNLKARITEASVAWPPPTLIHFPEKDW